MKLQRRRPGRAAPRPGAAGSDLADAAEVDLAGGSGSDFAEAGDVDFADAAESGFTGGAEAGPPKEGGFRRLSSRPPTPGP